MNGTGQVIIDNGGTRGANTLLVISNRFDLIISRGAVVIPVPGGGTISSLLVGPNGWFVPSPLQRLALNVTGDAVIQAGGGFNGDGAGFPSGKGIGTGQTKLLSAAGGFFSGGGGGYGG